MKRTDAFARVRERGGRPREGVTKQTGVLVVGELGWPLLDDGRPSNNLAQAKSYGVPIASERQFLEWLGRGTSEEETRTYTADQLAALSRLPPGRTNDRRGSSGSFIRSISASSCEISASVIRACLG